MKQRTVIKRGVILASAAVLATAYGCERPNPNKATGDASAQFEQCQTPSTGSGNNNPTGGNNTTTSGTTSGGNTVSTGAGPTTTTTTGGGGTETEKTELDQRVLDYTEALRTASILLIGDLPSLADVHALGDLTPDQQKVKYEEMIDAMLSDPKFAPRFSQSMIEFFKYTFKMGGQSTTAGEPTRDTAPFFAAQLLVEDKDWRNIVTQKDNTCPTYDAATGKFTGATCMVGAQPSIPANVSPGHSGILTNPGVQSLYFGNLSFRRNRFFHETFLCKSANETAGGEPSASPGKNVNCPNAQMPDTIVGYSNKWDVATIAGTCNTGRIDFHAWNANIVCANCHATWNHRSALYSVFNEKGMWVNPTGTYPNLMFATKTPVDGNPNSVLGDWLCIDPAKCPNNGQNYPQWKYDAVVDGVLTSLQPINISSGNGVVMSTAALAQLGDQISKDDEFLDCSTKRIWNYAMGRADIAEIGGRNWVTLDRNGNKNIPKGLLTQAALTKYFKENGYSLKKVLRFILVSDDFVRF
jgi:hypothetical protein